MFSGVAPAFAQHEEVQALDLFACPRGFAQKLEAGAHAGVDLEAADGNLPPQFVPAKVIGKRHHHGFERDAVQRVARLLCRRRTGRGGGRGCGLGGVRPIAFCGGRMMLFLDENAQADGADESGNSMNPK